ncbi:hypothetical protein SAMN05421767_12228 [Granulicatella balaenopterae]|uniref:Uncharacterized protein n=1 Tax=Granulicatella balaenopterae TaxID=137733 RepID=A0A1H9LXY4_9LACT|nr:hypothetical protein [Granulicatella balaenopterae]SER16306.1 hypothetical protein SAMN05421767_12228 [Granulicatella balaenopterae]
MCNKQVLDQQTDAVKCQVLQDAIENKSLVLVQLDLYSNSGIPSQFLASVEGILKNRVIFQKDGCLKTYQLANISAVKEQI